MSEQEQGRPLEENGEMPSQKEEPQSQGQAEGEGDIGARSAADRALEAMQERVAELEEQLLRTAAEFENYKKRKARSDQERIRFAAEPLVRDLLPVMDSFERAIQASEGTRDYQAFHDGVEMILQQLRGVLERHGVERLVPEGEVFDPNRHEAMGMMPHQEMEEDRVASVLEPGYLLNERVIRPAKVMVSSGTPEGEEQGGDGD